MSVMSPRPSRCHINVRVGNSGNPSAVARARTNTIAASAIGLLWSLIAAPAGAAIVLPPATFNLMVSAESPNGGSNSATSPGTITQDSASAGFCNGIPGPLTAHASATATNGQVDPSVSVFVSTTGAGCAGGSAFAQVVYSFAVVPLPGAPAGTPVPVFIDALGQSTGEHAGGAQGFATAHLDFPGTPAFDTCLVVGCGPSSFQSSGPYLVEPNVATAVNLVALAEIPNTPGAGGDFENASVDPRIFIDPGFTFASDFKLIFSSNLATAVPEPSSTALIGAWLVGLALYRVRRRAFP